MAPVSGMVCVSTFSIYTTYILDVRYLGGKLLILILPHYMVEVKMDSGKHEKANVKKIIRNDLFRKGNKLRLGIKKRQTCRGRGGGQHSREGTTFQEPGRPLKNWQVANDHPVVREERVWDEVRRRRSPSRAGRDLQAIIKSFDLILSEVGSPERFLNDAKSGNAAQVIINDPVLPTLLLSAPRSIFRRTLAKFQKNWLAQCGLWRQQSDKELITE